MRWGKAGAGLLVVARSTGKLLLVLRSADVLEPFTWGLPGGKIDDGENPRTAAARELSEETGYDDEVTVSREPILVYVEPDFRFSNFIGIVDDEFEPELNWENDDFGWFALTKLPRPLHPGVQILFERARPKIKRAIREATSD